MVFRTLSHRFNISNLSKASLPSIWRQLAACTMLVSLAACSIAEKPEDKGKIGYVKGFIGGVSADEPRAALVGRDVLSAGGTAADAVTAMYFAASVTMPATASLGGGGVCVVHDRKDETTEALDFLSKPPKTIPPGTERPVGVPMNARGFFILQSKYGDLRWAQLISPAENLARFGTQVSRALAAELKPVGPALIQDKEAARIFAKDNAQPVREGDFIKQFDLAATLTEIRTKGPGALYVGPFANRFVEAVKQAGGYITKEDLRDALPAWSDTVQSLPYQYKVAHFAPPAAAGGVVGAQIWSMLAEYDDFDEADEATRAHMLAESSMRSYGDRARWVMPSGHSRAPANALVSEKHIKSLMSGMSETRHQAASTLKAVPQSTPEAPSALSLAAVDRYGMGVACNVSMNNGFGVGRIAPQTGVLLSALPGLNGRGPMPLGPMLVVNPNSNEVYFAGAASRGVTAPTALVSVAARIIMGEQAPKEAMNMPRTHHGGAPDVLYHETNLSADVLSKLQSMGHKTAGVQGLGIVNAIACPGGLHAQAQTCRAMSDPRGYGLGVGAD
ncbi:Gamma-glutamyltranspeptidase [Candidatus Terasakiella magnetica]|uniref:Gamma-glutamyltranspeptidase n=1 Tax=Candidatus Terasakiella magnetica TaxID=1867952 RepID=A0A1C3RL61_9PROT|nr:gamma-glutamyltransferase [Candidatus Terasakiella magnetica]SCA58050.1 Gamma-glutamyltranspeptidase [Candidatus Terasakiella magnetica]